MRESGDTLWSVGFKIFGVLLLLYFAACATGNGNSYDLEQQEADLPTSSRIANLAEPACRDSFSAQVASVLVKQGETEGVASRMSETAYDDLLRRGGPGPFFVLSPAGTRYGFVAQSSEFGCVLRHYQRLTKVREHVVTGITDTLRYLDSRTLLFCSCGEDVDRPGA
jgi:hypothetical protein